jgi:beta-lactamase class D
MLASFPTRPVTRVDAPQWERYFRERGVEGTFVLHEPGPNRTTVFDEARAREGFLPASTFNVPLALIGLERGAVADADEVFRWDGRPRWRESWERDHTMSSAMREGVVWVFQAIARRVGRPAMREWLERLEYGNGELAGGTDLFWLQGGYRVSAIEQAEFLRRLQEGRLPVTARSRRIASDSLAARRCGGCVIRARSGTANASRDGVAWWVGWVERGGEPVAYFALNYRALDDTPREARFEIGHGILEEAGVLPPARGTARAVG